jgi:hypothetical protein
MHRVFVAGFAVGIRSAWAAAVGLAVVLAGCGRLSSHPLVPVAKEEISANPRVAELLAGPGGKVECGSAVTGRANDADGVAALEFEARGPRGRGTVFVEGKKLGTSWGVTRLELRPTTGEPLNLTADLEARTGVDTPRFDPTASGKPSTAPPPPAEIEITLPSGGPQ